MFDLTGIFSNGVGLRRTASNSEESGLDSARLFFDLSVISIIGVLSHGLIQFACGSFLTAMISISAALGLCCSLYLFKRTNEYESSVLLTIYILITSVSIQRSISEASSGMFIVWLPIIISFSVFLLGKSTGACVTFYTLVLCVAAVANQRYFGYFRQPMPKYQADLENFAAVFLGVGLGFTIARHVLSRVQSLANAFTEKTVGLTALYEQNSTMLSSMIHDISTPLSIILGSSAACKQAVADPALTKFGDQIHRNAEKINRMITVVRRLKSAESGKTIYELRPSAVVRCLQDAINLLSLTAARKSIRLRKDFQIGLDDTLIMADATALTYNIFQNLLSNAIKFSPRDSEIAIEVDVATEGFISILLRDQGIGIPPALLPFLFDPGHPTTRHGTDGETGSGFGLPICQSFVHRFGGKINIRSNADSSDGPVGTSVSVLFPLLPATI
jgi:signal transduction histidine kinase